MEGSIDWSNLLLPSLPPKPILSGTGRISSSVLFESPAPNWSSNILSAVNLLTNLLGTLFNFKRYGVSLWNSYNVVVFPCTLAIFSNTVSWAK